MGKILAIDFGKKRIGLAISDSKKLFAFPLKTIENENIFQYLKDLFLTEKIESIVLGRPKRGDNTDNDIMGEIKIFSNKLKKEFKKPIFFIDERFTSKIASKIILQSNLKKMKRRDKSLLDKVSASLILETYLKKNEK